MGNINESIESYSADKKLLDLVMAYIQTYDLFISKVARSVVIKCPLRELTDVKQDLILKLLTNYRYYDSTKTTVVVNPSTYFSQIIINGAKKLIRDYYQLKNRANIDYVSLDAYIEPGETTETFSSYVFENNITLFDPISNLNEHMLTSNINLALSSLKPKERIIFQQFIAGYSIDEIAAKNKRSKKYIYNLINNIRMKIKSFMN